LAIEFGLDILNKSALDLIIIDPNHEAVALAAGADAFLVKGCASKKLFEAILNRLKEDQ
jgi:hypothetical protein